MATCLHYNQAKSLRGLIYVLESKSLDFLQPTSFKVNGDGISLLSSIIIKSHMQVLVVQKELLQEKFLCVINKGY